MAAVPSGARAAVERSLAGSGRDWRGLVFQVLLLGALLLTLVVLVTLLVDQFTRALPVFANRGVDFLTSGLSSNPEKAGVGQGIVGTLLIGVLVALLGFPLGILTVYLEEYAPDNRLRRAIATNIANLAGVPSIVYGLLGLAVVVRVFGLGRSVLAGGLTLALLVMPMIVIASREALRAVPPSIRNG